MSYRKYRGRRSWLRAGAPLVLVLVGLVTAVAVARAGDPLGSSGQGDVEPLVAEGVTVGGVPVGGYTAAQATSAVEGAFSEPFVLTTASHIRRAAPESLGGHALVRDAVAGALRAHPGENVRLAVALDAARLKRFVSSLDRLYSREPRDARVVLVGLRPVVKDGREGLAVRRGALYRQLEAALTAGDRTLVRIPFKHTKPAVTTESFASVIVIQRSSNRLVVWDGKHRWGTFGVATGQPIYPTPLGRFTIVTKQENPWWYPPDSPWAQGLQPVPPGPGNPLGTRWMGISAPGVGIHGTPDAASIGYSASHGCIRMRIPDAERVFDHVSVGTTVFIVPA
ncbi:MAG TPA: L,D-transpeptidase family protein [Gaiellaceae bacterium]|nr:L,D-transpeptidase family protein [Gaiellaceae bacterium]